MSATPFTTQEQALEALAQACGMTLADLRVVLRFFQKIDFPFGFLFALLKERARVEGHQVEIAEPGSTMAARMAASGAFGVRVVGNPNEKPS